MTSVLDLIAPDLIQRKVLAALAAIDPFTGRNVFDGLEVEADGLHRAPVVNLSGYFVWQEEAAATPTAFRITPKTPVYQAVQVAAPPLPPPGAPGDRLVRVILQPSTAYPFPDSAVVLTGRLFDTAGGTPLVGVTLRLQWENDVNVWVDSPATFVTGADGRFACGALPPPGAKLAGTPPLLNIRLAATRSGLTLVTPVIPLRPGARSPPPGAASPAGEIAWDALQLP